MAINRPFSLVLVWITAFLGDLTLRVEAEAEVERNRLSTILEVLPVGLSVVDKNGRMVQTNPMMYTIWGQDAPMAENFEQYGMYKAWFANTNRQLAPDDWPTVHTLRDGRPRLDDLLKIQRFDGTYSTIEHSVAPIKGSDGSVTGAVAVFQDIAERRRLEQELEMRARELIRSNADLQQFAYVASHDLQEPLRMTTNFLGLLEREYSGKLDGEAHEYINYAIDGSKRMKILIDDLLVYSRIGFQGKPMSVTDMNSVVNQALEQLRVAIAECNATIRKQPLPTVTADETQMLQVMQNLLSNAIKFRGEEAPQIDISASDGGNEWIFAVKDNGIGINNTYSDKIFQMFVRLHSREEYLGTGVGLAICKRIIERHGGRIWVESEEGQGSTFYFTIPTKRGGIED
jgi:signal transduction histidine kinase